MLSFNSIQDQQAYSTVKVFPLPVFQFYPRSTVRLSPEHPGGCVKTFNSIQDQRYQLHVLLCLFHENLSILSKINILQLLLYSSLVYMLSILSKINSVHDFRSSTSVLTFNSIQDQLEEEIFRRNVRRWPFNSIQDQQSSVRRRGSISASFQFYPRSTTWLHRLHSV